MWTRDVSESEYINSYNANISGTQTDTDLKTFKKTFQQVRHTDYNSKVYVDKVLLGDQHYYETSEIYINLVCRNSMNNYIKMYIVEAINTTNKKQKATRGCMQKWIL